MPSPALLIPWLSVAAAAPDCAPVQDPLDRLACADPALAQQQSELRQLYGEALQTLPAPQRPQQAQQQERWQQSRAACTNDPDPHGCLAGQLARRIVELQITLQRVAVFATVTYHCPQAPLQAAYYHSEPAAVRLNYQTHEVIAFTAPAGSGARYQAPDVEIWEHQGVARFTWHGVVQNCPKQ
jgi:uncharacterized protein